MKIKINKILIFFFFLEDFGKGNIDNLSISNMHICQKKQF